MSRPSKAEKTGKNRPVRGENWVCNRQVKRPRKSANKGSQLGRKALQMRLVLPQSMQVDSQKVKMIVEIAQLTLGGFGYPWWPWCHDVFMPYRLRSRHYLVEQPCGVLLP